MECEKDAKQKGRALLRRMKGDGWKLDVWDNLGWHYALVNGPVTLYPSGDKKYFAMIAGSVDGSHSGLGHWTMANGEGYSADPNQAVIYAINYMRMVVNRDRKILEAALIAAGEV